MDKRYSYGKTPPDAMKKAVEMVKDGCSLRKAAENKGVAHETLARCVKKYNDSSLARMSPNYAVNAIFTAEEEQSLATYVKKCSQMFYELSLDDVKRLAYQTAITNSKTIPKYWIEHKQATDGWLKRFRKRNPSLSFRTPEGCILSRSPNCFSSGTRIYNLDETGLTTVQVSAKILAEKGTRQVNKVTSVERGALVTLCCIISATGQFIPPVMIFPRVHFKDHMLSGAPPATLGLANSSGWMNSECFVKVMEHFVNFTLSSKENPTLLIMDNHESHINLNALNIAKDNGVVILTLPPHSSSKMQPLDVTVYKPFKTAYNNAIDNFMMQNPEKTFTIYDIAAAAGYAFEKSMTPSNIVAGFRKTGIYPPDREVFTDVDFMCSDVTDRPLTLSNQTEEIHINVNGDLYRVLWELVKSLVNAADYPETIDLLQDSIRHVGADKR
ncbi:uncharacterized protein LOC129938634 [Eupeodes corollae]|uniref:uncharacterized protein LOC129938634 n=1 Tax=Eupeodes corollae TaxID=290404 RepID=UPI0024916712|nr:uncharacterized protein LOC129938634 [Eupeodes corollae]